MEPYFIHVNWKLLQFAGSAGGQAIDIVLLLRLLSVNHARWQLPDYVVIKLDLYKAFDRVKVSAVV
eukprot:10525165-Karenia_brevis.AAC.1